jgi:hypothetical protein
MIFNLKHVQAKLRKNNFNYHCDGFRPVFQFVLLGGKLTKVSSFRRKINQSVLRFMQNLPKCPPFPLWGRSFSVHFLYNICVYTIEDTYILWRKSMRTMLRTLGA